MTINATDEPAHAGPGGAVRDLRKALGLTQERLAELGGWEDRLAISQIENGRNRCSSVATLRQLATAFGMTLDEVDALFEGRLTTEDAVKAIQARKAAS